MSKSEPVEGVPVRLDSAPDHRAAGVAVVVPEDVSAPSVPEPKSGQTAASNKEK